MTTPNSLFSLAKTRRWNGRK